MSRSAQLANFAEYRGLFDRLEAEAGIGMELGGIPDEAAYQTVVNDDSTVFGVVDGQRAPLLTPASVLGYVNLDYYKNQEHGTGDAKLWQTCLPANRLDLLTATSRARRAMGRMARQGGVVLFDYVSPAQQETETREKITEPFVHALGQIGIRATAHNPSARHYHYHDYMRVIDRPKGRSFRGQTINGLWRAYQTAEPEVAGDFRVVVERKSAPETTEALQRFYNKAHETLNSNDPITANLTDDELKEVMEDPHFLKLLGYERDMLAIALVMVDARCFPYLNQDYLASVYPREHAAGRIICAAVAARNEACKSPALSLQTMGMVGKLMKEARIYNAVLAFACDDVSKRQLPGLSVVSLARQGIAVRTNREDYVSTQNYGALGLSLA